ncbi:hypothetical protein DIT71_15450 [Marinobacter vulgaris]|uniref:Polymer-forming cytoskeletal protein n=1 Tax=Marinobacter vulgaris TaxID=1928331 RepID=A0A2V3ZH51_9GAMM|nr:hypothetical protein DIT71_15450 [Marinobacter vulgaris]
MPVAELEALCSSKDISVNGTTITCRNGSFDIEERTITADEPFELFASNGFDVSESVIGDSSYPINLTAQNGDVTIEDSEVSGSVQSNNSIDIDGSYITGDVTSQNGEIDVDDSAIGGSLSSQNGSIAVESSNIAGNVGTQNGGIRLEQVTVGGSVTAPNRLIEIENTTVSGDVTTQNGSIELSEGSIVLGTCSRQTSGCEEQSLAQEPVCTDAFSASNGQNPNSRLDLSGARFGNARWPETGATLAEGIYRYRGEDLSSYTLNVVPGERVVIFVNGSVDFNNKSNLNSGDPENLVIVVNGDFVANNNLNLNGIVYASGSISIKNGSEIQGMLSAAGDISIDGGGKPSFDAEPDLAPGLSIEGVCGRGNGQGEVDHFRIFHPSEGLTCTPAGDIRVQACANSGCTELFDEPVSVELSPESGWSRSNPFSFVGDSGDLNLRSFETDQPVQLGISGASEVPTGSPQVRCFADGAATQSDCQINFSESGFYLYIDDHVSGQEVPVSITAVKAGEEDPGQCVPAFSGEKEIQFSTSYQNPNSGTLFVEHSNNDLNGTNLSLDFNNSGLATFPVQYRDVGSVLLRARYEGAGEEAGLVMTGQDDFVARPDRFEVVVPESSDTLDLTMDGQFRIAGQSFGVEVRSLNSLGQLTPNFGNELPIAEDVVLNVEIAPSAPVPNLPELDGALGSFGESCATPEGGKACGEFSWSEVGALAIEPALVDSPYLASEPVTGERLDYVGRFVPDHFALELVDEDPGAINMACGGLSGFTYSGQDTGWAAVPRVKIIARNTIDEPTLNYLYNPFMRLPSDQIVRELPSTDDDQLLRDEATAYPVVVESELGAIESRADGEPIIYRYGDFNADIIRYQKNDATSRVKQFTPRLTFEIIEVRDDDDRVDNLIDPFSINPSVSGEIFYGRLTAENVYGPEDVEALSMPFRVEYWDGNSFIVNSLDSCTRWSTGDIENPEKYHELTPDGGEFDGGEAEPLELIPSGEQGTDTLAWTGIGDWLRDDTDGDDSLDDPSATATFGVYRGNDRIIYWQEVLN